MTWSTPTDIKQRTPDQTPKAEATMSYNSHPDSNSCRTNTAPAASFSSTSGTSAATSTRRRNSAYPGRFHAKSHPIVSSECRSCILFVLKTVYRRSIAATPQRPPRQNLRFAPEPEYEVININEDGWTETSGSRPTTPTPSGQSCPPLIPRTPPLLPRTPQTLHSLHTLHLPQTPHSSRTAHTPKSPRAGPHSQAQAEIMRAQRKKTKKGADVSMFFEVKGNRRYCILCQ